MNVVECFWQQNGDDHVTSFVTCFHGDRCPGVPSPWAGAWIEPPPPHTHTLPTMHLLSCTYHNCRPLLVRCFRAGSKSPKIFYSKLFLIIWICWAWLCWSRYIFDRFVKEEEHWFWILISSTRSFQFPEGSLPVLVRFSSHSQKTKWNKD